MKTIIEMAREAGAAVGNPVVGGPEIIFPQCLDVQRFAELVRADERERALRELSKLGQEIEAKPERDPWREAVAQPERDPWREAVAQPEERNFCPRCGKRTADLTTVHTCTPPKDAR